MKTLILTIIASMTFTNAAQASYFDITCSTASGETTHVSGHRWKTVITKHSYEPVWTEVRVDITEKEVRFEQLEEPTVLHSYSSNKCGMSTWGSTYTVKAKLYVENEAFDDNVGGARDGVITDFFICEESGNSMGPNDPTDPDCN